MLTVTAEMLEHRNSGENRRKRSEIFFENLRRAYKDLIKVKKNSKLPHACVPLNIGTTLHSFILEGKTPELRLRLKIWARGIAISFPMYLIIFVFFGGRHFALNISPIYNSKVIT
jgi:hypothetical protein